VKATQKDACRPRVLDGFIFSSLAIASRKRSSQAGKTGVTTAANNAAIVTPWRVAYSALIFLPRYRAGAITSHCVAYRASRWLPLPITP